MKKAAFGYILVGLSLGLLIANIYHNVYLAPSTSVELFRSIQNTGDYEEVKSYWPRETRNPFLRKIMNL